MFLKAVTELAIEYDTVRVAMLDRSQPWLAGLGQDVGSDHDRLLVDVGLPVGGHEVTRRATLVLGDPMTLGDKVVSLPLTLQIADHARLFPVLEGSLDAAWLGSERTHLALAVHYEPPFGPLGRAADAALLHRVAELVTQHFLEAVAARLSTRCVVPDPAAC